MGFASVEERWVPHNAILAPGQEGRTTKAGRRPPSETLGLWREGKWNCRSLGCSRDAKGRVELTPAAVSGDGQSRRFPQRSYVALWRSWCVLSFSVAEGPVFLCHFDQAD